MANRKLQQPKDKEVIMAAVNSTTKSIINVIQRKLNNRVDALSELISHSLDNMPVDVKKMQEEEASKLRVVILELRDIIDIAKTMYPDG